MYVIYQPGSMLIHTELVLDSATGEDVCRYTGRSATTLLEELNATKIKNSADYLIMEAGKARALASKTMEEIHCHPWAEIGEDDYNTALNCLPPEKWFGGIFRMSEYVIGNVTRHYVRIQEENTFRYFTACRTTSMTYSDMVAEIRAALPTLPVFHATASDDEVDSPGMQM